MGIVLRAVTVRRSSTAAALGVERKEEGDIPEFRSQMASIHGVVRHLFCGTANMCRLRVMCREEPGLGMIRIILAFQSCH